MSISSSLSLPIFHSDNAGINGATCYTYDGHSLNYTTGELADPAHLFSAPSKESIQLGMLALGLQGLSANGFNVTSFFHVPLSKTPSSSSNIDNIVNTLTRKITTYETYNATYPGYGGFMPWVSVNDSGIYPPSEGPFTVPGLDNGEMIWGLYAVTQVLNKTPAYSALAQRYQNYLNMLRDNAKMIFYTQPGYINSMTLIGDIYAMPTPENYKNDCDCYLDDPYEGEMLTVFMDLYCEWDNDAERDQLWINKRNMLQSSTFVTPKGNITVQKGFWFSSHEQWKYLMLPYQDVEINQRVFVNGERARTWFSYLNNYPGLFASVNNVTAFPSLSPNYMSASGIQEIAFQNIPSNDVMTPYGAYPLFLVNELGITGGLAWYFNMLSGPAMQNQYGSTESINNQGTEICSLITWDSKMFSMMGGAVDLNRQGLTLDGKMTRFMDVINREWSLVFNELEGENLDFMMPQVQIPMVLSDYTTCN
eukprot:gene11003-12823_t